MARQRKGRHKIPKVLGEFKRGTLRSGSGAKVKKRKQAVAIGLSEARKAGARIPRPTGGKKRGKRRSHKDSPRRRMVRLKSKRKRAVAGKSLFNFRSARMPDIV